MKLLLEAPGIFNQCCWKGICPWLGGKKDISFTVMADERNRSHMHTLPQLLSFNNASAYIGSVGNRYEVLPPVSAGGQEYWESAAIIRCGFLLLPFHSCWRVICVVRLLVLEKPL